MEDFRKKEEIFSLPRFFLSYKKLKSLTWVGGRVLEKKINKNFLKLKISGQGKVLILKKEIPFEILKNLKLFGFILNDQKKFKNLDQSKKKKTKSPFFLNRTFYEKTLLWNEDENESFYRGLFSVQKGDLVAFFIHPNRLELRKDFTFLAHELRGIRIFFRNERVKNPFFHGLNFFFKENARQDSKEETKVRKNKLSDGQFYFKEGEEKQSSQLSFLLKESRKFNNLDFFFNTQKAVNWNAFIMEVRSFFNQYGFIEIQTPSLVRFPGVESTVDPFSLEFKFGSKKTKLFLSTSPEIHLKKLLCRDWSDIFEIKNCFRNSELSSLHEPEFWMLEWYRAFCGLDQIEKDLRKLLGHLKKKSLLKGSLPVFKKVSIKKLFNRYLDFALHPETSLKELRDLSKKHKVRILDSYDWNDLFCLLFLEKIEPHLKSGAYIIYDYPPQQTTLARFNQEGWAMRFEFYWKGLEIANAFDELIDLEEHIKRFCGNHNQKNSDLRSSKKHKPLLLDKNFLLSLANGMPPSAGVALGLDRLFLACQGLETLKEIRPFSIEEQL